MKKIILAALIIWPLISFSQTIEGHVYENINGEKGAPLPGTAVRYQNSGIVAITDSNGSFELPVARHDFLIAEYVGYYSDTVEVSGPGTINIYLVPNNVLKEAVVKTVLPSSFISHLDPRTTIRLSTKELSKAPCCNLSESFETTPSVDVSFSDAVTGVKQIKMLGLNSRYALLTRNAVPLGIGPDNFYSMEFIPGPWIGQIELTKGVGSVASGMQPLTGHINVGLKSGDEVGPFFFDGYINEGSRMEGNLGTSAKVNEKLRTTVLGHASTVQMFNDRNNDGFRDIPEMNRLILHNNWRYSGDKWNSILNLDFSFDERMAGTESTNSENPNGVYALRLDQRNISITNKTWYQPEKKPYQNIGLQTRYVNGQFDNVISRSAFPLPGPKPPISSDNIFNYSYQEFYQNLIFNSIWNTTLHKFKAGLSYHMVNSMESYGNTFQSNLGRSENELMYHTLGAYYEHLYTVTSKLTLIGGLRADLINGQNIVYSPRLNLKYELDEGKTTFRLSSGQAHRRVFVMSEFQNYLYSNRAWNFSNELRNDFSNPPVESGWTHGASISHNFRLNLRKGAIFADYYLTEFSNQLVADFDDQQYTTSLYYTTGLTQSAHVQVDYNLYQRLDLRLAYRWYGANVDFNGGRDQPYYLAPHRVFMNVSYETRSEWKFDLTVQAFDGMRLPETEYYGGEFARSSISPRYVLAAAQINKNIGEGFEIFLGVENALDYRQPDVIISASDVGTQQFDATQVWGPIRGRMAYIGFRSKFNRKQNSN